MKNKIARDTTGLIGLAMLGYGLWLYNPIAMFVGIGIILLLVALLPYVIGAKKSK
jgi:hypothetical protein